MSRQIKKKPPATKIIAYGFAMGGNYMGEPTRILHPKCKNAWRIENKIGHPVLVSCYHPGAEKEQLAGKKCDACGKVFRA